MSLVSIARNAHDGQQTNSFRLNVEGLEDRSVPASLISGDYSSFPISYPTTGGDANSTVIGSSANGNYLLIQSLATNMIVDPNNPSNVQLTPPGQYNLFWYDRGGKRMYLISAYDPTGFTNNPQGITNSDFAPGTKSVGVRPSLPGQPLNAVITDDGNRVAFISSANAAYLDPTLGGNLSKDGGGDDMFVWAAPNVAGASVTGTCKLVSRDYKGSSIGSSGSVTNPFISADGKRISFVSAANINTVVNNPTILDPSGNPVTQFAGFSGRLFTHTNPNARNIYAADIDGSNNFGVQPVSVHRFRRDTVYFDVQSGVFLRFSHWYYQMADDITVDPLNRYSTIGASKFVATRYNGDPLLSRSDLWTYRWETANLPYTSNINVVTLPSDPALYLANAAGQGVGALNFGTVQNAIFANQSSDILFTYRKTGAGTNGDLLLLTGTSTVPYVNQNGGGADLYLLLSQFNGTKVTLVTAEAGAPNKGGNAPLSTDPRSYNINPDASYLIFSSTANNLIAANALIDNNGASDVFRLDLVNNKLAAVSQKNTQVLVGGVLIPQTGNGASDLPYMTPDGLVVGFESQATDLTAALDTNRGTDLFIRDFVLNDTIIASAPTGSTKTANAVSSGIVVVRGTSPNPPLPYPNYYRNYSAYFGSAATDLDDNATTLPPGVIQVYGQDFPIYITKLPREYTYSGGIGGQVAVAKLDAKGNTTTNGIFKPFGPNYTGEIRVALADVNGDGVRDSIAGAGPGGGPRIVIIDGFNGQTLDDFFAFESSFTGGVYVAGYDMNGDGNADLIVGAGEGGGPRVQIYDSKTRALTLDVFAFESNARTGVRVAAGDVNGDGIVDLVVSAGIGGGPRVRVFDGAFLPNIRVIADFFVFEQDQRGGAYVSLGDYDGDLRDDIVVGGGPGGGPRVSVFNSANFIGDPNKPIKFLDFFAFNENLRDGARPVLKNIEGNKTADVVVATAGGLPQVNTYSGARLASPGTPLLLKTQYPFDSSLGFFGAWVG